MRVAVVDGHPIYRSGLAEAVRRYPGLGVACEIGDARGAVEQIVELAPDVAVIDLHLPGGGGLQVLTAISRSQIQTRTVVLASEAESVYEAIEAGAAGYVLKEADAEVICSAIATVAAGESALAPELTSVLARQVRNRGARRAAVLTARECEILALVAEGLSADAVGQELALSSSTIKTHLTHVYEKLNVSCAPAAVHEAMRLGILT